MTVRHEKFHLAKSPTPLTASIIIRESPLNFSVEASEASPPGHINETVGTIKAQPRISARTARGDDGWLPGAPGESPASPCPPCAACPTCPPPRTFDKELYNQRKQSGDLNLNLKDCIQAGRHSYFGFLIIYLTEGPSPFVLASCVLFWLGLVAAIVGGILWCVCSRG